MAFLLRDIADKLGAQLLGDGDFEVDCIATLANAKPGNISFLSNKKYRSQLADSQASAVLLHPAEVDNCQANSQMHILVLKNPYLGYAMLAKLMDTTPSATPGIAPTAVVDPTATVAATAAIGAHTVIGAGAVIEDNVIIGSGCFIGEHSVIGRNTRLWSNISIYHQVTVGTDCLFQSGVVIGSDGFGYAPNEGQWIKIPQLGGVTIGDRVEIGANTCIDRGALDDTTIGNGVIIDNQCHIAHNVIIGDNTAMAGGSMIAGSTSIGTDCTIAGKVGIAGHLTITDKVLITSMSQVIKDIPEPGAYSSGMGAMDNRQWRKVNARIRQLDDMHYKIRNNEKAINRLLSIQDKENQNN